LNFFNQRWDVFGKMRVVRIHADDDVVIRLGAGNAFAEAGSDCLPQSQILGMINYLKRKPPSICLQYAERVVLAAIIHNNDSNF